MGFALLFWVVFALTVLVYCGPEGRQTFLDHSAAVLLAAILVFIAYCLGMKALRALGVYLHDRTVLYLEKEGQQWRPAAPRQQEEWAEVLPSQVREPLSWEKTVFATGIGLGILSYVSLALALLQLYRPVAVLVVLGVMAFAAPGEIRWIYRWSQWPRDWRRIGENQRRKLPGGFLAGLQVVVAVSVVMSFFSSLAPPHQSDALRYHLAVPMRYAMEGGWLAMPDAAFSNFPFTIEMLYGLPLVLGWDVAARLLHFAYFGLTLAALYAFGKRFYSAGAGWISTAVFACTPFVPILASWAFIEMGMVFYYLLSFYGLALWMQSISRTQRKKGWLGPYQLEVRPQRVAVLTGLFVGLAMGVKYTALFLAVYVFAVMLIQGYFQNKKQLDYQKMPARSPWISVVWMTVAATLVFCPWMIKNFMVTGNPLFPFLNSLFQSPQWSEYESAFYGFHAGMKGGLNQAAQLGWLDRVSDVVTLPWRATTHSFGGWQIGPFYLVFSIFVLLFVRRVGRPGKFLVLSSLYFFLVWSLTYRDNRFLLPVLVLLALLFGLVFGRLFQRWADRLLWLRAGFLGLLIFGGVEMAFNQVLYHYPFGVVSGAQSREEFLRERLDYYSAYQFLNALPAPQGDKVLLVGEYRPYYCRRSYIASDWFNQPAIIKYLEKVNSPKEAFERMEEDGIRYIMLNERELDKGAGDYRLFFHFHFLKDEEAIALLEKISEGTFTPSRLEQQLAGSRSYQIYGQLWHSEELREITPRQAVAKGIRIFEIRQRE
jgi:4-amino-4-deoxy-L-arabinose transferase-like glycosyltransferase